MIFRSKAIAFIFWVCIIDLAITVIGIEAGIFSGERNPILNIFFTAFGITGLICSKLFLTIVPIAVLAALYERYDTYRRKIDICCTYGGIAYAAALSTAITVQMI